MNSHAEQKPSFRRRRAAICRACARGGPWKLCPTAWLTPRLKSDLHRLGFEFGGPGIAEGTTLVRRLG